MARRGQGRVDMRRSNFLLSIGVVDSFQVDWAVRLVDIRYSEPTKQVSYEKVSNARSGNESEKVHSFQVLFHHHVETDVSNISRMDRDTK